MHKVVFDTNIYISAFLFGGIPQQLVNHALNGTFILYISKEILTEVSAVLAKKFSYPPSRIKQVTDSVNKFTSLVYPTTTISVIKNWPPDNRILECCQEANAHYLVSGDKKHLLPLKKFYSTQIVTPQQFLNLL